MPPYLKDVARLLCEIWSKTGSNVKYVLWLMTNGKLAKHLSCDGLFDYKFITQFAGERSIRIGEHLAKLQAKSLIVSRPRLPYTFVLKDAELAR